jgi:hypothetical protein
VTPAAISPKSPKPASPGPPHNMQALHARPQGTTDKQPREITSRATTARPHHSLASTASSCTPYHSSTPRLCCIGQSAACLQKMASPYNLPAELPSYAAHRMSQSFDPNIPPAPPPKPSSQEVSRQSTPAAGQSLPAPPLDEQRGYTPGTAGQQYHGQASMREAAEMPQDPGDRWLPKLLEDKSYDLPA